MPKTRPRAVAGAPFPGRPRYASQRPAQMLALRPTPRPVALAPRVAARPALLPRRVVVQAVEAPVALPSPVEFEAEKEVARAIYRYVRGSPNKVRRVLDVIRGRSYEEALGILEFLPHRCAGRCSCQRVGCGLLAALLQPRSAGSRNARRQRRAGSSTRSASRTPCSAGALVVTLLLWRGAGPGRAWALAGRRAAGPSSSSSLASQSVDSRWRLQHWCQAAVELCVVACVRCRVPAARPTSS